MHKSTIRWRPSIRSERGRETHILCRFTRTRQHAARQHSKNVGEFAARLFAQTTDLEMDYVKESMFGVSGWRQSWREIIQRCKNCSRHAQVSCNLLRCAFCSYTTLNDSPFVSRRDVGWGAVRDVLLREEQREVCSGRNEEAGSDRCRLASRCVLRCYVA